MPKEILKMQESFYPKCGLFLGECPNKESRPVLLNYVFGFHSLILNVTLLLVKEEKQGFNLITRFCLIFLFFLAAFKTQRKAVSAVSSSTHTV